jgi:hypothetical protein
MAKMAMIRDQTETGTSKQSLDDPEPAAETSQSTVMEHPSGDLSGEVIYPATDEGTPPVDLEKNYKTLVGIVETAQAHFLTSRRGRLRMLYEAGFGISYFGSPDFERLCTDRKAKGDFPETRLIYLCSEGLSEERRAEYGAIMRWVHTPRLRGMETENDPEKLIDHAITTGMDTMATQFRQDATAHGKPGDFGYRSPATTAKAKATRAKRADGKKGQRAFTLSMGDVTRLSPAAQAQVAHKLAETAAAETAVTAEATTTDEAATAEGTKDREWSGKAELLDYADLRLADATPLEWDGGNFILRTDEGVPFGVKVYDDDANAVGVLIVRKKPGEAPKLYDDKNLARRILQSE